MIYVSRYQNARGILASGAVPVGFTRGNPRFRRPYELAGNVRQLAPHPRLWGLDGEAFDRAYREQLDALGVDQIRALLEPYRRDNRSIILCCFEDLRQPGARCHRTTFAAWWQEHAGEAVHELPELSPRP